MDQPVRSVEEIRRDIAEANLCGTPMRHADKSVSPCVLSKDHRLNDSDHRDVHGHTAKVLVSQSTIREVGRVAAREAGSQGKTFGEMTPDERESAIKRAARRLQEELTRDAEAIGRIMDEA